MSAVNTLVEARKHLAYAQDRLAWAREVTEGDVETRIAFHERNVCGWLDTVWKVQIDAMGELVRDIFAAGIPRG